MLPGADSVNASPRKLGCKLVIGGNTITDIKLLTYASDWSGSITIGQVVSSYITATLPTPSFSLAGANVSHSMSYGDPATWVDIGQYKIEESSIRTRQGYTSFSAYDKLHNTVNTYHSSLTFPASLQAICNEVCSQIGITSTTLGVSFTVEENVLDGYTLRDVLGFIAAVCGKNAYLSPSGALELRWFTAASYTADGTRANVPYIGENNSTVNRLICQTQSGTISAGSGAGIYFTCPIMTQDRLNAIQSTLSGFTYRKADVDIPYGNFCIQSGDIITVTTTGSSLTVPVMANSWTYDGGVSSSVSAYDVSDYSGTANNAERSATAQRVQGILDAKRAESRESQIRATVEGEIINATALITGAIGGYIKLEFGGSGKTAQLLVMDEPDENDALNIWIFNQNGLGHMQRASTSDPWSQVNVALTREGTVVAERIAGTKITGVALESTPNGSGQQPQVVVENGTYTINRVSDISTQFIGSIKYEPRTGADHNDTLAVRIKRGGVFMIGDDASIGGNFYWYSDPSSESGGRSFVLYGDIGIPLDSLYLDVGNIYLQAGDLVFSKNGGGTETLKNLEARVKNIETYLGI